MSYNGANGFDVERDPNVDRMADIRRKIRTGEYVSQEECKFALVVYERTGEPSLGLDILRSGLATPDEEQKIFLGYWKNPINILDGNVDRYRKSGDEMLLESTIESLKRATDDYRRALDLGHQRAQEREQQKQSLQEQTAQPVEVKRKTIVDWFLGK